MHEAGKLKTPGDISIHLGGLTNQPSQVGMLVLPLHGGNNMLTKYALVAIIVLCFTVLMFTLMVRETLCELSVKERGMEFKAVLACDLRK